MYRIHASLAGAAALLFSGSAFAMPSAAGLTAPTTDLHINIGMYQSTQSTTERSSPPERSTNRERSDKPNCFVRACKDEPRRVIRRMESDREGRCELWRAVRTAKVYGIRDPELGRLTNATISLIGTRNGYMVRVEMDRKQRHCHIKRVVRM